MLRWIIGIVLAILAIITAVSVAWLDEWIRVAPEPGALVAERSRPNRTAAACVDRTCIASRAPIGAYDEYRRCGGHTESARAGEARLACSESALTDLIVKKGDLEGQSLYRQFRRACRTHDLCYIHTRATYDTDQDLGAARRRCDDKFLADIVRDCALIEGAGKNDYKACRRRGMIAYSAVHGLGWMHWREGGRNVVTCDYEPGAHAPRDQVVSGRFVPGTPLQDHVVTLVQDKDLETVTAELVRLNDDGTATTLAKRERLAPAEVPVADRDAACVDLRDASGQPSAGCPSTLGQTLVSARDWLRFSPIVVDSDGDGTDEIILPTLTSDFGLAFTQIRIEAIGGLAGFAEPKAYLAVHRASGLAAPPPATDPAGMTSAIDTGGPCEAGLELNDCPNQPKWAKLAGEPRGKSDSLVLSHEVANQILGHNFVVVARNPEECRPLPDVPAEEILLLAGHGQGFERSGHRLHRFTFDAAAGRWFMRRDKFTNDGHRMRRCDREDEGPFEQSVRLVYPAFAVRGPVKCEGGRVAVHETLTVVAREKCPSSVIESRAGELNDIDLMTYALTPGYDESDDALGTPEKPSLQDDLQMAKAPWIPINWNESADPVMTSRSARGYGIMMAGAYVGGTGRIARPILLRRPRIRGPAKISQDRTYPLIAMLRIDDRLRVSAKEQWQQRQADTAGIPPVQYALFSSLPYGETKGDVWRQDAFGDPAMFFDLPSVLAPFDMNGNPGLSVVLFANRASFEFRPPAGSTASNLVKPGHFHVLVAPLPATGLPREPRILECEVPPHASLPQPPARDEASWSRTFLDNEPVLPGLFFNNGESGGLAITYRTAEGGIGVLPLRYANRRWWLGGQLCSSLTTGPLTRGKLWMMRLN